MVAPSLVVCGADTGDGKTWLAVRLTQSLRESGHRVAVLKPLESGVDPHGPLDAHALCDAAGWPRTRLADVCPWQLPRPVTPAAELQRLGITVTGEQIREAAARVSDAHDLLIVESAGGVRSPLTDELTSIDLALLLDAAVLLVVGNRLGAISRAVCAVRECERAGAKVLALVLNTDSRSIDEATEHNARFIAAQLPGIAIELVRTNAPLPTTLLQRVASRRAAPADVS